MSQILKHTIKVVSVFFILTFLIAPNNSFAADGEALFKANCASCHKVDAKYVGPPLKGARDRAPSPDWVYKWIRNPITMVQTDDHAKALYEEYGSIMTPFPDWTDEEIDAVLDWADAYVTPGADGATGDGAVVGAAKSDNTLLYGLLTLVLAIVALILLQVNSSLRKMADESEGVKGKKPVPIYRNKAFLLLFAIVASIFAGYFLVEGAVGLGRQQGYQPEQPIFYSHEVHAGVNQISCLYCHGGAQEGKHANIPSVNVCMNCHISVTEYTGDPLYHEDGSQVDANAEIQKLYEYAGYNPDTKTYDKAGKPIEWVKIHNLPDHVYFNHAQHVRVGQVACQTCHGEVQKMDEVKQFATLSMGWCINCHRTTNVQFNDDKGNGNQFYSIYEKFHEDIKNNKYDSVTVEQIGGTDCAKCHY